MVNGVQLYSAHNSHNSNPRTPKQLAARARFSAVMQLARTLNGVINIGLRLSAAAKPLTSPTNIFTKRNNKLMLYDADSGYATPDYEHLILSEGRTPCVEFSNTSFSEPRSIQVSITSPLTSEFGAYDNDTVYMAVLCPDREECVIGAAKRSDTLLSVSVPPSWVGKDVHIWGFTKTSIDDTILVESIGIRLHSGECSSTSYIGTGTIA